jgi:hypothetical protein
MLFFIGSILSTGFNGGGLDRAGFGAGETIRNTGHPVTGQPNGGAIPGPEASILADSEETGAWRKDLPLSDSHSCVAARNRLRSVAMQARHHLD